MALTYHPEKHPDRLAQINYKFCQICEAFEVLSTNELRDIYDRYGIEILKNGPPCDGSIKLDVEHYGYCFSGDPMELFESFFGTTNPKNIALDEEGRQISLIEKVESDLHKDYVPDKSVKAKDIKTSLWCTLHEFFHGSKKTIQYTRFSVTGSSLHQIGTGAQVSNERVTKQIDVMPGMRDGTELRFPGWGNNPALKRQGDLVIVLRRTDHATMVR